MQKNCPTHELNIWMVVQTFYARLNFMSRNLLYSAAGGTFMGITLGEATKLLNNMTVNYSQWHTERAPTGRNVNYVKEISSLNEKFDTILSLLATKQTYVDFIDENINRHPKGCLGEAPLTSQGERRNGTSLDLF